MKTEPTVSSETSANRTHTPGNYPKRNKLHLEHGESLKTRLFASCIVHYDPEGHCYMERGGVVGSDTKCTPAAAEI